MFFSPLLVNILFRPALLGSLFAGYKDSAVDLQTDSQPLMLFVTAKCLATFKIKMDKLL